MQQHTKRITAAVTPDIAAIYEKLAVASGRTLSSIVSDVLASRARECLYFLRWLGNQPAASARRSTAIAAVGQIARSSLVEAVRTADPGYRAPFERVLERRAVAEAALLMLEDQEARGDQAETSADVLDFARRAAVSKGASRWRDEGSFILLPEELEEVQ